MRSMILFKASMNNADVHCVSQKSFSARLFSPLMAESLTRKGTRQKGFLATPFGALRPILSLRYTFSPYVSMAKKPCLDLELDVKPVSNCIIHRCLNTLFSLSSMCPSFSAIDNKLSNSLASSFPSFAKQLIERKVISK